MIRSQWQLVETYSIWAVLGVAFWKGAREKHDPCAGIIQIKF